MNRQVTFTGFESPEYREKEFLDFIEPDLRAAIESMGSDSNLLSISSTKSYTAVKFKDLTAFRLKVRGGQRYISIPTALADMIPNNVPNQIVPKDPKYRRILITDQHPLDSYSDFLISAVIETVNRYPKEWDCCSRYLECSNAKTCVHPDKAFALVCGYRRILSSGKIFYGENRNI